MILEDTDLKGMSGCNNIMVSNRILHLVKFILLDIAAIIYVVACCSFNMVVREDGKTVSLIYYIYCVT